MQAENQIPHIPHLEIDELFDVPEESPSEDEVLRQFRAVLVAGISLLMGLVGNLLFYATPVGINVVVYMMLFSLVAFGILVYFKQTIIRKHALFAIPAALFALLLSLRLAPELILFNVAAMLGSMLIVMHFTGTKTFLGGHWVKPLLYAAETGLIGWMESVRVVTQESQRWLGQTKMNTRQLGNVRSVLRGIMITLPVVVVFALLLSSADAVFGDFAQQALSFLLPQTIASVVEQLVLVTVLSVICVATYWTMVNGRSETSFTIDTSQEKLRRFRLNMIETSTLLASVNILFVVFVLVQARYFFGGEANITAQGFTYAEYARRGFYELLAVSCMTMALLVTVETLTYRKREEERVFRGLVILMVALTLLILIAAFQRLNLYENAYGFTRIRVMSGTLMIWLAALLCMLLVAILWHKHEVFWIGCIAAGMGFILSLNLINMDGYIASHNIARFEDSGKLDVYYLLSLSDDAVPTLVSLLDNPELGEADRDRLLRGLGARLYTLDRDREERSILGYHFGKNRAWNALDDHREDLQPYIYSRYR